ncbi:MAG: hypothetical protein AAGH76_04430 [Pseudomonadota bacterium]
MKPRRTAVFLLTIGIATLAIYTIATIGNDNPPALSPNTAIPVTELERVRKPEKTVPAEDVAPKQTESEGNDPRVVDLYDRVAPELIDTDAFASWAEGRSVKRAVVVRPNVDAIRSFIRSHDNQVPASLALFGEEPLKVKLTHTQQYEKGPVAGSMFGIGTVVEDPGSSVQVGVTYAGTVTFSLISSSYAPVEIKKMRGADQYVLWESGPIEPRKQ